MLKRLVWILWTLFFGLILYACMALSLYWFIAFVLWFVPAYYIMRWIEDGIIDEINKKL